MIDIRLHKVSAKWMVALCWALAMAALTADAASAGTYTMKSCNVPGNPSMPATGWQWTNTPETYSSDACLAGGGFAIGAGPMQRATAANMYLDVPSDPAYHLVAIRRVRLWLIARLAGSGSWLFVAWSSSSSAGVQSGNLFGPPGGTALGVPISTPLLHADTKAFNVVLSCSGNTWDGCYPMSPLPLEIRGAEVELEEFSRPGANFVEMARTSSGVDVPERSIVRYEVFDQESGVTRVSVRLGSTVVGVHDYTSECRYDRMTPCPRTRSNEMNVDTSILPSGSHRLTLTVTDAAGNEAVVPGGVISVGPQSAIKDEDSISRAGAVKLTARLVGRGSLKRPLEYRAGTRVRGRLTTSKGVPLREVPLEVVERTGGGKPPVRAAAVVTGADGRFTYKVRALLPSRTITIAYRSRQGRAVIARKRLRVWVAAAGTMRVGLRGVMVRYRGSVQSRPLPRRGKLVLVQGRAIGGAWTTFARHRTSRAGTFSGVYRLRVRRPGVKLQFRMVIGREPGYPFALGASRVVTRTVR